MALATLDAPASPFPFPDDFDDGEPSERLESAPDVAEYTTDTAVKRLRSKPSKYKEPASPSDDRFARFRKADRPMLRQQWQMNKNTRKHLQQNAQWLRTSALQHQCPLLVAKAKKRGDYDPRSLKSLLRTRMKCVARADDGLCYDKHALIAYIKENMETRLVSPVTRQPMNALVLFAERQKAKPDEWKTSKWVPTFAPLVFSDGEDAEVSAEK